jgi:hypothetical protein
LSDEEWNEHRRAYRVRALAQRVEIVEANEIRMPLA